MYAEKIGAIVAKMGHLNAHKKNEVIDFFEEYLKTSNLVNEFFGAFSVSDIDTEQIELFLFPFLDTRPSQQHLLACLNIPLHGNHFRWDESTVRIFMDDNSIEGGDHYIFSELEAFFNEVGLGREVVRELYYIAQLQLPRSTGVIFQFIDEDDNYSIANNHFYPSLDFGFYYPYATPQEIILGVHPLRFKNIDLQLRLVIGNQHVLNPFSGFKVKRYDENGDELAKKLNGKIREYLRVQNVDQQKKRDFQDKLQKYWVLGGE